MRYKLEVFDVNIDEWKFLLRSDDIEYIRYYFNFFCKCYPKEHFRIIEVLEIK